MKAKFDYIFWGLILMLVGCLALFRQQGWIEIFSLQFWMYVFGAIGVIFLIRYLVAGWKNWGFLFPACIFSAVAGVIWLGSRGVYASWIASPILAAIVIPFLVAFMVDFPKNWWALIPAFILSVVCLVLIFDASLPGEFIGALMMFAIATPFAVVYLTDRERKWALIPAFTLGVMGVISLIGMLSGRWIGAFVPFAISIPFFYVYFRFPQHWWALIPAGVMASVGINVLLTDPALGRFAQSAFPGAILFLGWAATFGWLWQQRAKYPTAWARFPALISSIVAIVLLVIGSFTEFGVIIVMIVVGLYLIYRGLQPKKEKATPMDTASQSTSNEG